MSKEQNFMKKRWDWTELWRWDIMMYIYVEYLRVQFGHEF